MVGEPAAKKQTHRGRASAPSSVEARPRGRVASDLLPRADLRFSRRRSDDRAGSPAEQARVTHLDAEGSRAAAARDARLTDPAHARRCDSSHRRAHGRRLHPGASVTLATLPGPAVLVVRVAGLEEVQAGLADEDPRAVGLDSNAEESRALCLAAVAGLLADAFGLPDVRPTPGRTLSGAPAMRSLGAVAPRLLTSNRGAAALARQLEPPSGSAVRRDHDEGSACLERSPSTTGADHAGASAAPGDPSRPTSDAR